MTYYLFFWKKFLDIAKLYNSSQIVLYRTFALNVKFDHIEKTDFYWAWYHS